MHNDLPAHLMPQQHNHDTHTVEGTIRPDNPDMIHGFVYSNWGQSPYL